MNAFVVFIRRPVFATMVTAFLVVLGLLSYRGLGVDQLPQVDLPVVNIFTSLRGASPEEVETQVTKPIEEAVNTIGGIDEIRSYSLEGASFISVSFALEKSTQEVVQDVRDRVALAQRELPSGTDPPVVTKLDLDAIPVAVLVVQGPRDLRTLREMAEKQVKPLLETVDGVGQVGIYGGWKRAVNLVLDASKLDANGLSVQQVAQAIRNQHVDVPGGRIERGERESGLRTMARMELVRDFNNIVVAQKGGHQVKLSDVGRAEDTYEDPRSMSRQWRADDQAEKPSAVLFVRKQSGGNTVELVDRLMERLKVINTVVPADIRVEPAYEQGSFVRKSMNEVGLHLVLGALLASLTCYVFIRDWRATVIAALSIPTSIIATFALIKAMGFTLNNMTMLALTLSVGIVIDDAIVVLENIHRQMEVHGKPAKQAAVDGLKEIALAVLATTFSLIVIFLPVAFMSGRPGRFWHSYGITVAFAIFVSLIVSFTLTPMLCSKFLKVTPGHVKKNGFYEVVDRVWGVLLRFSLKHRWMVFLSALFVVLTTGPIFGALGKDFLPSDDRSQFQVKVELPEGSSLWTSSEAFRQIERDIRAIKGVKSHVTVIGDAGRGAEDVTAGTIWVNLIDLEQRDYTQAEVMAEARKLRRNYPGIKMVIVDPVGIGGQYPINLDIRGADLETLYRISNEVMSEMNQVKGLVDVDSTLSKRSPEIQVRIDRDRAADVGVRAGEIALSLRAFVGGQRIGRFQEGAEQYDIWIRVERADRTSRATIGALPMGSLRGGAVPLADLVNMREGRGPQEILRLGRQRSVTVFANLDGLDMGRAMGSIGGIIGKMKAGGRLPEGYAFDFGGRGKVFREMTSNFVVAFGLAFLFMYMILAAQFESFLHPITILLSLPLSLPCALVSLLVLGETFNLYSGLGLFMLFGVVKKNGILQIDYTNTLRNRGMPRDQAILEANHARLRPILMTTLTLIVGMIPIALGKGPGAASRASMAKVIIGGQALSLVISLLIVPVAYAMFDDVAQRLRIQADRSAALVARTYMHLTTTSFAAPVMRFLPEWYVRMNALGFGYGVHLFPYLLLGLPWAILRWLVAGVAYNLGWLLKPWRLKFALLKSVVDGARAFRGLGRPEWQRKTALAMGYTPIWDLVLFLLRARALDDDGSGGAGGPKAPISEDMQSNNPVQLTAPGAESPILPGVARDLDEPAPSDPLSPRPQTGGVA